MTRSIFLCVTLLSWTISFSQKHLTVGQIITSDFNGDSKVDTASLKAKADSKTKRKNWILSFSDKTIPTMQLGCCDPILINEGDLNGDKATELSIFKAPENCCVCMWTTYSLKSNRWTKLIQPFLIATDCEDFKPIDLQKRVFKEDSKVYYWGVAPNDEENKPIKKQVVIR